MLVNDSLLVAAVGLLSAILGSGAALAGGALLHRRERDLRRLERLRSLYADVLRSAVWLVPFEFGFRLSDDTPPATARQIDALTARLRLETWWDGDHIFEELKELYRAVTSWEERVQGGGYVTDLSEPSRHEVIKALDRLENEMRKNLGVPTPVLIPRRPRP